MTCPPPLVSPARHKRGWQHGPQQGGWRKRSAFSPQAAVWGSEFDHAAVRNQSTQAYRRNGTRLQSQLGSVSFVFRER